METRPTYKRKAGGLAGLRRKALRLRGESGQTLVLAALSMVVLVAFLGLSIDAGQMRYAKRRLQNAADAAALAGALELQSCGGTTNCSALQAAAQNALVENGFTGSTLLLNCAAGTGTKLEVTISNPPCANASDPNLSNGSYVEAIVSQPQPTVFARVLGINSVRVMARGEAARGGGGNCIYVLDPYGSGALSVNYLAALTSSCGIVVESNSSSALGCVLFGAINAPSISVVGGYSSFWCNISPAPTTGGTVPNPADPLATLAAPAVPPCGTSTRTPYHGASSAVTITGAAVLYADAAYCGGITIAPGANVTFEPGTYVLTSTKNGTQVGAGGLTVDVGTTVNGTGVMFYNYGPAGGITFKYTSFTNGGVSLVAPTSGTYAGILFFQNAQDSAQATILGTSSFNTVLEGTYYFPTAKVLFAFDGAVNYNILVAYDIQFTLFSHGSSSSSSAFSSNYSSLANGSPVSGTGAAVVE